MNKKEVLNLSLTRETKENGELDISFKYDVDNVSYRAAACELVDTSIAVLVNAVSAEKGQASVKEVLGILVGIVDQYTKDNSIKGYPPSGS